MRGVFNGVLHQLEQEGPHAPPRNEASSPVPPLQQDVLQTQLAARPHDQEALQAPAVLLVGEAEQPGQSIQLHDRPVSR